MIPYIIMNKVFSRLDDEMRIGNYQIMYLQFLFILLILLGSQHAYGQTVIPGHYYTRDVPGWINRPYTIYLPNNYSPSRQTPIVLMLHGGGGSSAGISKQTCPGGDLANPNCFYNLAGSKGFVTVFPNGTLSNLGLRTWNAGGGASGWTCVSGSSCQNNEDDINYFRSLLQDLKTVVSVDNSRIFATGMSDGAAMCQRLACELSDKIAAIAPVAGGNQFSTTQSCSPVRAVPVLEIHGSADPVWSYSGGSNKGTLGIGATPGAFISITQTISGWTKRDNCIPPSQTSALPVVVNDGTSVLQTVFPAGDSHEVVLYQIVNGGHTWPGGWQYYPATIIGKVSQNLNANKVILDFFATKSLY